MAQLPTWRNSVAAMRAASLEGVSSSSSSSSPRHVLFRAPEEPFSIPLPEMAQQAKDLTLRSYKEGRVLGMVHPRVLDETDEGVERQRVEQAANVGGSEQVLGTTTVTVHEGNKNITRTNYNNATKNLVLADSFSRSLLPYDFDQIFDQNIDAARKRALGRSDPAASADMFGDEDPDGASIVAPTTTPRNNEREQGHSYDISFGTVLMLHPAKQIKQNRQVRPQQARVMHQDITQQQVETTPDGTMKRVRLGTAQPSPGAATRGPSSQHAGTILAPPSKSQSSSFIRPPVQEHGPGSATASGGIAAVRPGKPRQAAKAKAIRSSTRTGETEAAFLERIGLFAAASSPNSSSGLLGAPDHGKLEDASGQFARPEASLQQLFESGVPEENASSQFARPERISRTGPAGSSSRGGGPATAFFARSSSSSSSHAATSRAVEAQLLAAPGSSGGLHRRDAGAGRELADSKASGRINPALMQKAAPGGGPRGADQAVDTALYEVPMTLCCNPGKAVEQVADRLRYPPESMEAWLNPFSSAPEQRFAGTVYDHIDGIQRSEVDRLLLELGVHRTDMRGFYAQNFQGMVDRNHTVSDRAVRQMLYSHAKVFPTVLTQAGLRKLTPHPWECTDLLIPNPDAERECDTPQLWSATESLRAEQARTVTWMQKMDHDLRDDRDAYPEAQEQPAEAAGALDLDLLAPPSRRPQKTFSVQWSLYSAGNDFIKDKAQVGKNHRKVGGLGAADAAPEAAWNLELSLDIRYRARGGVLADSMGTGKTVTTIGFLCHDLQDIYSDKLPAKPKAKGTAKKGAAKALAKQALLRSNKRQRATNAAGDELKENKSSGDEDAAMSKRGKKVRKKKVITPLSDESDPEREAPSAAASSSRRELRPGTTSQAAPFGSLLFGANTNDVPYSMAEGADSSDSDLLQHSGHEANRIAMGLPSSGGRARREAQPQNKNRDRSGSLSSSSAEGDHSDDSSSSSRSTTSDSVVLEHQEPTTQRTANKKSSTGGGPARGPNSSRGTASASAAAKTKLQPPASQLERQLGGGGGPTSAASSSSKPPVAIGTGGGPLNKPGRTKYQVCDEKLHQVLRKIDANIPAHDRRFYFPSRATLVLAPEKQLARQWDEMIKKFTQPDAVSVLRLMKWDQLKLLKKSDIAEKYDVILVSLSDVLQKQKYQERIRSLCGPDTYASEEQLCELFAKPVPMQYSEVFTELQRRVADGKRRMPEPTRARETATTSTTVNTKLPAGRASKRTNNAAGRELQGVAAGITFDSAFLPASGPPEEVVEDLAEDFHFPVLEMFYFRRIIFDEFHQYCDRDGESIAELEAKLRRTDEHRPAKTNNRRPGIREVATSRSSSTGGAGAPLHQLPGGATSKQQAAASAKLVRDNKVQNVNSLTRLQHLKGLAAFGLSATPPCVTLDGIDKTSCLLQKLDLLLDKTACTKRWEYFQRGGQNGLRYLDTFCRQTRMNTYVDSIEVIDRKIPVELTAAEHTLYLDLFRELNYKGKNLDLLREQNARLEAGEMVVDDPTVAAAFSLTSSRNSSTTTTSARSRAAALYSATSTNLSQERGRTLDDTSEQPVLTANTLKTRTRLLKLCSFTSTMQDCKDRYPEKKREVLRHQKEVEEQLLLFEFFMRYADLMRAYQGNNPRTLSRMNLMFEEDIRTESEVAVFGVTKAKAEEVVVRQRGQPPGEDDPLRGRDNKNAACASLVRDLEARRKEYKDRVLGHEWYEDAAEQNEKDGKMTLFDGMLFRLNWRRETPSSKLVLGPSSRAVMLLHHVKDVFGDSACLWGGRVLKDFGLDDPDDDARVAQAGLSAYHRGEGLPDEPEDLMQVVACRIHRIVHGMAHGQLSNARLESLVSKFAANLFGLDTQESSRLQFRRQKNNKSGRTTAPGLYADIFLDAREFEMFCEINDFQIEQDMGSGRDNIETRWKAREAMALVSARDPGPGKRTRRHLAGFCDRHEHRFSREEFRRLMRLYGRSIGRLDPKLDVFQNVSDSYSAYLHFRKLLLRDDNATTSVDGGLVHQQGGRGSVDEVDTTELIDAQLDSGKPMLLDVMTHFLPKIALSKNSPFRDTDELLDACGTDFQSVLITLYRFIEEVFVPKLQVLRDATKSLQFFSQALRAFLKTSTSGGREEEPTTGSPGGNGAAGAALDSSLDEVEEEEEKNQKQESKRPVTASSVVAQLEPKLVPGPQLKHLFDPANYNEKSATWLTLPKQRPTRRAKAAAGGAAGSSSTAAASGVNGGQDQEEQVICTICHEEIVDKPYDHDGTGMGVSDCVILACGHIFCRFCLEMHLQTNKRDCPTCRESLPPDNKDAYFSLAKEMSALQQEDLRREQQNQQIRSGTAIDWHKIRALHGSKLCKVAQTLQDDIPLQDKCILFVQWPELQSKILKCFKDCGFHAASLTAGRVGPVDDHHERAGKGASASRGAAEVLSGAAASASSASCATGRGAAGTSKKYTQMKNDQEQLTAEEQKRSKSSIIDHFLDKKNPLRILILSLDQQATGLNLQVAHHVLFLHPMNTADFQEGISAEMQAIGRVRRVGQESKQIFVWRFFAKNTVEEEVTLQHEMEVKRRFGGRGELLQFAQESNRA
ncbi:unnamed protein product [Amoebophrya sp. A120]|nr:unnamed protein product [Amoebophrya sp. A120]|eukprot:GSA120T00025344001.1